MTFSELTALAKDAKRIGIIGYPGAGKTTLANRLGIPLGIRVIHTDDYLNHSHDDRPSAISSDLHVPFIVEGNEVTRLINRGLELDLLLLCIGSERDDKSVKGLQGRVDKFMKEYRGKVVTINPRWVK